MLKRKGLMMAFGNTIPYAIVPLIFLIQFNTGNSFGHHFADGAVLTFAKDVISLILLVVLFLAKDPKRFTKIFKEKSSMYAMVAGIFGGPIGYTLYNTAFYEAGASYGHIFTSLEPIFLIVLGILIFKRKYKWQLWMGVGITVVAVSLLVLGESQSSIPIEHVLLGALLGTLGSLAWGIEVMLFDKAFNLSKGNTNGLDLLYAKMFSSIMFSIVVMIPVSGAIIGDASYGFNNFGKIFTNNEWFVRFIVAGFLIAFARTLFFLSIKSEGGTLVGVIYNLTIILTPLIALIYYGITKEPISVGEPNLDSTYQIVLWTLAPFIAIGVTLVTLNNPKIERN